MSINLIAAVVNHKGRLCIGAGNDLICKIPNDLKNFKRLTETYTVVMGRKTWESLRCKPLPNRTNIVLTNKELPKIRCADTFFMSFSQFRSFRPLSTGDTYFVIGGGEIYDLFMKDHELYPSKLYLTHIKCPLAGIEPDTWLDDKFLSRYTLNKYSDEMVYDSIKYRYLYYDYTTSKHEENQYTSLIENIIETGNDRPDRTGTGTLSIFGTRMKFDISKTIPMMTTRSTPFRVILEELLFFCRGDTDSKLLRKKGVKIWDGNTSRDFLDNRGLDTYNEGIMGPIYGYQWRHFGAKYDQSNSDTSKINTESIGGIDQLKNVEYLLKNDPFSRRIIITAWNPEYTDQMALAPCHILIQFYVEEIKGVKHLSCQFYQRSSDQLAFCFNVVSYSILTHILAKKCGMVPRDIIYTAGDCHVYKTHVESVKTQLERNLRPFPIMVTHDEVIEKDWSEITVSDFELVGYFPHQSIKMPMAI
jgi:dihydrofolate reductase/thymidylate synthase